MVCGERVDLLKGVKRAKRRQKEAAPRRESSGADALVLSLKPSPSLSAVTCRWGSMSVSAAS